MDGRICLHYGEAGPMLRVWHGKGEKFRETPIPSDLYTTVRTLDEFRDAARDDPLLDITTTRTLRRWVERAAGQLAAETDNPGWNYLTFHDLRRTWATALKSAEVDSLLVYDWGGWDDLETFLEHYRGTYSPDAQKRERGKVEWL